MYSVYKLNKQADNIHPWHTPFPISKQSIVPCLVLTIASGFLLLLLFVYLFFNTKNISYWGIAN